MRIAFLLYPTAKVKTAEDSSFWIMHEMQKRGHRVTHFESDQLFFADGSPHAFLTPSKLDPKKGFLPSAAEAKAQNLSALDCLFIRKEPPFDAAYLHALQLLEMIREKTFILNDPRGIAMCNEKLLTLYFNRWVPETLISSSAQQAKQFIKNLGRKAVIKPLDDKGGRSVFAIDPKDTNLPSLLDTATDFGRKKILVQSFVPSSPPSGDKRILILDGKIIGTFLRKPPRGDFRANLGIGAKMMRAVASPSDRRLVEEIAPFLLKNGLFFTGIDVLGKYLLEVNVTSPSGIPEINYLEKKHLEKDVADFIEKRTGPSFGRRRFAG